MLNTKELLEGFSKLVRSINTRNPKWKEHIGMIYYELRLYLNNEIFHHNIIQYELEINRIGQSIIECNIKYIEKVFQEPKNINFEERVKTPNEVCKTFLYEFENSIIYMKNKHSAEKVSGILPKIN